MMKRAGRISQDVRDGEKLEKSKMKRRKYRDQSTLV